jgi:ABC-type microcin C transport system permease subunit YejB
MAKKNRISELDLPPIEIVVAPMPDLPATQTINETVAKMTGKAENSITAPKKESAHTDKEKKEKKIVEQKIEAKRDLAPQVITIQKTYGRPKKEKSVEREKYTTWLHKDLIVELKYRAAKKRCTPADIIEDIISTYIQNY